MSTLFTAYCHSCDEEGPELQRKAGGTGLIAPDDWGAWLNEHEFHDLHLLAEGGRPHCDGMA